MCMSKKIAQKPITLESVAISVETVASSVKTLNSSVGSLSNSVQSISELIKLLATKEEMKALGKQLEDHIDEQIDNLAISTAHEFGRVHKKFDEVHVRFDGIDKKITKTDTDIDNLAILVSKEIGKVSVKLDEMDKHLVSNYINRRSYVFLDKRVHSLEKAVFGE